jgi:hypothetical protein
MGTVLITAAMTAGAAMALSRWDVGLYRLDNPQMTATERSAALRVVTSARAAGLSDSMQAGIVASLHNAGALVAELDSEMEISDVLSDDGARLRRQASLGGSVADLAKIHAADIEGAPLSPLAVSFFGPHSSRVGWLVAMPKELADG